MQRSRVRQSVPQEQDREQVKQIIDALCRSGQFRAAAIVLLARATGMRLREAILADLPRLCREASKLGRINIPDGTKGGRTGASAQRWIGVDDHVLDALAFATKASPAGSCNMIAPKQNYKSVLQKIAQPARKILHALRIKGFHELRAAYACERYEHVTRNMAPINGGALYRHDRYSDAKARIQIARELGHGRIDIISAYIGGSG